MDDLFLDVLNISITATWVSIGVMIVRLILKKAPKWISCILWAIVGIRLVFPFSIESVVSLIPSSKTINTIVYDSTPYIQFGIEPIDSSFNNYLGDNYFEGVTVLLQNTSNILTILGIVWITGIIVMMLYTFISFLKLKKSVNESALLKENIWICDNIHTPFILGVVKPRIYIPSSLNEQDGLYVLAHEKAHLKRLDHLWKPLGFFILSFYWFNPVLWIAYVLLCRDIESACDEKVIRDKGNEIIKAYSTALLNCSISRKNITACPLALGETGIKERVKGVLSYKKPAFWIIVVAVIVVIITSVCLLTNPKTDKLDSSSTNINLITASTNCDLVSYEFVDSKIEDGNLLITAKWTNNSDKEFSFGEEFVIYKDGEILDPKPNVSWLLIGNLILPQQSIEETYDLTLYYNITENGEYRLEKEFSSPGNSTYKAYIEFTIDDASNVGGVDKPQDVNVLKDK